MFADQGAVGVSRLGKLPTASAGFMLSSYRACAGLLHARAHRVDGVGRVWTGRLCHRVCAASIRARAAGCICIELGSVFGRPCSFPLITLAALIYVDNRQEHNRPVRIAMFGHFYDRSSRAARRTCKHEMRADRVPGAGRYEPNASFFYELMSIARRGQRFACSNATERRLDLF